LWPALVNAKHSEKPSISKLTDAIIDSTARYIDTFSLTLNIPDHLVNGVVKCWTFNQGNNKVFNKIYF
jgi:hypothetical protein